MRRSMSRGEYETLAAFRYALRQFLRFSEVAAQEAGLTPQQYQALLAIKGYPGRDPGNHLQVMAGGQVTTRPACRTGAGEWASEVAAP